MIFQLFKTSKKYKCAFDCIWETLDDKLMDKFFNFIENNEKIFSETKLFSDTEKLKSYFIDFFKGEKDFFEFNLTLNKYQKNIYYQLLMKSFNFSEYDTTHMLNYFLIAVKDVKR